MKHRGFYPLLVSAICLLGSSLAVAGDRSSLARRGISATSKPALEQGMSASEVKAIIGQPLEVRPMNAPNGNAEVWTYRRALENHVWQTATQIEFVPAFSGIGGTGQSMIRLRPQEVYNLERIVTYQVTELLMFEGQLIKAKQWKEARRSYQ
jgi:hypothetical protein